MLRRQQMTWLAKFGSVILKIVGIATGMMPLIQGATGNNPTAVAVEDKLSAGFNVIATAEQMFTAAYGAGGKGSDKLKATVPFIAGIVQSLPHFTGKKPKDEAAFEAHCAALASSMADIFNDYGD
jgi:hypothetical protein